MDDRVQVSFLGITIRSSSRRSWTRWGLSSRRSGRWRSTTSRWRRKVWARRASAGRSTRSVPWSTAPVMGSQTPGAGTSREDSAGTCWPRTRRTSWSPNTVSPSEGLPQLSFENTKDYCIYFNWFNFPPLGRQPWWSPFWCLFLLPTYYIRQYWLLERHKKYMYEWWIAQM